MVLPHPYLRSQGTVFAVRGAFGHLDVAERLSWAKCSFSASALWDTRSADILIHVKRNRKIKSKSDTGVALGQA